MNVGWIKMHRQIMDKSWYSKPSYVSMWATLLLLATHRGMEVWFAGKPLKLKPGQLITGRKSLAKLTGIHESSVQRILSYFEKIEHQIEQRISNQNRLITVINWDRYQGIEHQAEQPLNIQRTSSEQPPNTNNNVKNVKNDENVKKGSANFEKIKAHIIRELKGAFFTSVGKDPEKEITKMLKAQGFDNTMASLNRYIEYHRNNKIKYKFAHRWNKFRDNPPFFDESEFREMVKRQSGGSATRMPTGYRKELPKKAKELNRLVKEAATPKGGSDEK